MRKLKNDKSGFTLVELMIVVVVLGILVAIAVPIFSAVTENAKKKTCRNNIDTIEKVGTQFMMARNDENIFAAFTANSGGGTTRTVTIASEEEATAKLSPELLLFFDSGKFPICEGHTYTVEINAENEDRSLIVTCSEHGKKVG